jgi:hypothetical protein
VSELNSTQISAASDRAAASDTCEAGTPHHRNGVHAIKRELATDMADLTLAVAAGDGDGLFGSGAAYYGGMLGGSASSVADLFTGPATIGHESLNWLGSFSTCNVYGASMSAEIDEERLLFALSVAHEEHSAPQFAGESAQTNLTLETL